MGQQTKRSAETYMGDQAANTKEKGETKDRTSGGSNSKRGAILKGLPGREDMSPKAGYPSPANFQNMRNQDPAKGTI